MFDRVLEIPLTLLKYGKITTKYRKESLLETLEANTKE